MYECMECGYYNPLPMCLNCAKHDRDECGFIKRKLDYDYSFLSFEVKSNFTPKRNKDNWQEETLNNIYYLTESLNENPECYDELMSAIWWCKWNLIYGRLYMERNYNLPYNFLEK